MADTLIKNNDNNENIIKELEKEFIDLYKKGIKTGNTWEILDKKLILDPYDPYLNIFRDFNKEYFLKEFNWYKSKNLSIKTYFDDVKIWDSCASKDGNKNVNSNYGYLVFDSGNYNQFDFCFNKLKFDKNSREAMIIYTRPSIQIEFNERGKQDFICTNYSHFFIRDDSLIMIHSQRSCDLVTGLPFDFAWTCFVYQLMYAKLKDIYPDLKTGSVRYNIDSLHIYERSEKFLKNYKG